MQRCKDKIRADYVDEEPWPPAASLLDLVRCTVVMDDPYAMAVFIAYLQRTFRVVRIKNRFAGDAAEAVSVEQLLREFYAAETRGEDTDTESTASGSSGLGSYEQMYRDIMLNIEMDGESGTPFVCEVQVTLSGITILKKSEQAVYTIMRMQSAEELLNTYVFAAPDSETKKKPVIKREEDLYPGTWI
jgi:hypothetical protein